MNTPYNKAVVAGVGFLATLLPIFGVNFLGDPAVQSAIASLVTTVLVYLVPNKA